MYRALPDPIVKPFAVVNVNKNPTVRRLIVVSLKSKFTTVCLGAAAMLACLSAMPALAAVSVVNVPPTAGGDGIQKALDNLAKGGEVDLEAGTYVVHQPIILQRDGQTLRGA